jgi:RNA polymerase sigma-70 factor (ECF subfamily)
MRMSLAVTITWEWTAVRFRPNRPDDRPAGRVPESTAAPNQVPAHTWTGSGQTPERALERTLEGERQTAEWQIVVQRCLDGDSLAWTELVKAHHRRVYGLCYRFTGSAQDAEDLTQDVFIKIYGNLGSFDFTRGTFQTWITTLTRNLLVDHFRRTRQQRVTDSMDAGWDESDEQPMAHRLSDSGPTQHDRAVQKQIEKMVQEALTKLSPELREAVILRDLQDMDYKEIAQVLHIPEGTVKSRISRGRAELARLLERNKGQVV